MDETEKNKRLDLPDEDYIVYIPDKDYHSFIRSLNKMKQAQEDFHNIKDNMKSNYDNSINHK